jgi:hypothetical protein
LSLTNLQIPSRNLTRITAKDREFNEKKHQVIIFVYPKAKLTDRALERQATRALALVLVSRLGLSRSLLDRSLLCRSTVGDSTVLCRRRVCLLLLLHLLLPAALQSLEVDLGDSLVESLALRSRDLELLGRRHAGSIAVGKSTRAPSGAAANLAVVAEQVESGLVAERHVDDSVVGERAHGGDGGALLATALGRGADEQARVLAPEAAGLPLLAGVVPEGPPLGGEVAVAGGDAHQEGVVLLEGRGVGHLGDRAVLFGSVHLGEDLLGEGLGDAVEVDLAAGLADALGLSLGELLDVAIGGVL